MGADGLEEDAFTPAFAVQKECGATCDWVGSSGTLDYFGSVLGEKAGSTDTSLSSEISFQLPWIAAQTLALTTCSDVDHYDMTTPMHLAAAEGLAASIAAIAFLRRFISTRGPRVASRQQPAVPHTRGPPTKCARTVRIQEHGRIALHSHNAQLPTQALWHWRGFSPSDIRCAHCKQKLQPTPGKSLMCPACPKRRSLAPEPLRPSVRNNGGGTVEPHNDAPAVFVRSDSSMDASPSGCTTEILLQPGESAMPDKSATPSPPGRGLSRSSELLRPGPRPNRKSAPARVGGTCPAGVAVLETPCTVDDMALSPPVGRGCSPPLATGSPSRSPPSPSAHAPRATPSLCAPPVHEWTLGLAVGRSRPASPPLY